MLTQNDFPNIDFPVHPTWNIHDPSKLQTFLTCPRKYFWEYVAGWRPDVPSNHLVFGTAMHKALEHLYRNGFDNLSISRAFDLFLAAYRPQFPEDTDALYWPKTPNVMLEALLRYTQQYRGDLDKYELLHSEVAGTVGLDDSHVLHFRMDTIFRERASSKYLSLEHKSGSNTWNWEMQWPLMISLGTYTHCLYCLYGIEETQGILVNGIFFKKNKTNTIEFLRVPVLKTPSQMQSWLWTTLDTYDRLDWEFERLSECSPDDAILQAFPQNCESCTKYTGCPYHDFCCTWANPLNQVSRPQPGFRLEYWDPRADETREELNLDWKGTINSTISAG